MNGPRLLGNRYELGEVLGLGGMSEVYRAGDTRLGRTVAVKVLRPDLARDPSFLNRFRREAQAAASLNHPAIVAVFDTGEENAGGMVTPYIVMEYVEGRTLREILVTEGPLLPQRALEVVADVCGALEYSHHSGIVHRDIKPANVMMTRRGEVKVMDFGIARAVASTTSTMTQTAAVIGTAQYLSPEQARGENVDARSDLYSTGCLLYELLTGVPPFTGDSPVAVAYQHVREEALPPSSYNREGRAEISDDVDAVVLKAMAKNPANRYQSAGEMRADLERAVYGRRVLATPLLRTPAQVGAVPRPAPPLTAPPTTFFRADLPEDEQGSRDGGRRVAYALLALAVLAVFAVAALVTLRLVSSTGNATVAVPTLIGLPSEAAARDALEQAGLGVGNVGQRFSDRPVGQVVGQDPPARSSVASGRSVDITVSQGNERVSMPQLVGRNQTDAVAALRAAGLAVGTVVQQPADAPAGQVVSASDDASTQVPKGSKVDLVVASGQTPVPDVVGRDAAAARAVLERSAFLVDVQTTRTSEAQPGTVVAQQPQDGTAARGSTVRLTVAEATPSPSPSPSPAASPTAEPSPTNPPSAAAQPAASATVAP